MNYTKVSNNSKKERKLPSWMIEVKQKVDGCSSHSNSKRKKQKETQIKSTVYCMTPQEFIDYAHAIVNKTSPGEKVKETSNTSPTKKLKSGDQVTQQTECNTSSESMEETNKNSVIDRKRKLKFISTEDADTSEFVSKQQTGVTQAKKMKTKIQIANLQNTDVEIEQQENVAQYKHDRSDKLETRNRIDAMENNVGKDNDNKTVVTLVEETKSYQSKHTFATSASNDVIPSTHSDNTNKSITSNSYQSILDELM